MTTEILKIKEGISDQTDPMLTVNEMVRQLEGRTIRVLSRSTAAQPASPSAGDTYILPASPTGDDWGAWNEHDLVHFYGGVWHRWAPVAGLRVTVIDETLMAGRPIVVMCTGSKWVRPPGLFSVPTKTISADYTVPLSELGYLFVINTSGGNVTLTLPATSAAGDSAVVAAVKINEANQAIIDADGAETISGEETVVLEDQWASTQVVSGQGSQWYAFGGGGSARFPFADDNDLFANEADATKILKFALSAIATGTTRVATWPDKDGTVAMLSDVSGGGNASNEFDEDGGTTTGLTWGWQAGGFRVGETVYALSAGTIGLTDDATNYVFINLFTQAVEANTTGFPWACIPLRQVTTSAGSQTASDDQRAWLQHAAIDDVLVDHGDSGAGTVTIDYRTGKVHKITATGDFTLAFSNLPASAVPADIEIVAVNWGAHSPDLSALAWGDSGAPTFSSAARDRLIVRTDDGGTNLDAMLAGQGF